MNKRNKTILKKIMKYIFQIEETIKILEINKDVFMNDFIPRNAISMCVLQIGELSNALTKEFISTYNKVSWRDIISVRHSMAHNYINIDLEIVWQMVTENIPELKAYCENILKEIE